jgi:hypothetical protein
MDVANGRNFLDHIGRMKRCLLVLLRHFVPVRFDWGAVLQEKTPLTSTVPPEVEGLEVYRSSATNRRCPFFVGRGVHAV